MSRPIRRLLILGPPLALAVWETLHPREETMEPVIEVPRRAPARVAPSGRSAASG